MRIPAWLVLGSWFVLQWLYSAGYAASGAGSVAYVAHVFGFLAGAIIGLFVRADPRRPSTRSTLATAESRRAAKAITVQGGIHASRRREHEAAGQERCGGPGGEACPRADGRLHRPVPAWISSPAP